jgi:enoyl-CoA hydratase/carnithine racemase
MNDYKHLLVERNGDTVTIWLNNPERRNVLTRECLLELTGAFDQAGSGSATGVILAAKGPVFCAGHDFAEVAGKDLQTARDLFETCTATMDVMQAISQPVIARVHALATGAGCQLVAAADLAVASEGASFCTPGGRGGLFCTTPLVAVGRVIARKRALEMAMSGDPIDARTAEAWGLVNYVVSEEDLESATNAMMQRVTRGSALSKGIGKRAFYQQIGMPQAEAYNYAIEEMAKATQNIDAQEGFRAFLEKRPPHWGNMSPD